MKNTRNFEVTALPTLSNVTLSLCALVEWADGDMLNSPELSQSRRRNRAIGVGAWWGRQPKETTV
jgi:hypothetical protein